MKQVWILLFGILFLAAGCGNEMQIKETPAETNEPVWVVTEQISYDTYGNVQSRRCYQYKDNSYNYRTETYNEQDILTGYTDVSRNKDGTETTTTNYLPDGTEVSISTQIFRPDGRLLKEMTSVYDRRNHEKVWEWNKAGTKAEIYDVSDGQKQLIGTQEYDQQNRVVHEKTEDSETTYTYEDKKITIRSDMGLQYVYYLVRVYDEQGRLIETRDYKDFDGGSYTEDDLVSYGIQTYKEDGHSLVNEYYVLDEVTGEKITGSVEAVYQPLEEVLIY